VPERAKFETEHDVEQDERSEPQQRDRRGDVPSAGGAGERQSAGPLTAPSAPAEGHVDEEQYRREKARSYFRDHPQA